MNSIERRVERFRILYTWKSIMGLVPSLGFTIYIHHKKGKMIREIPNKGRVQSVKTKKYRSQFIQGPILFNSLPRYIRELEDTLDIFTTTLDLFLTLIPDQPVMDGYRTQNKDLFGNETNSVEHWIRNLNLDNWANSQSMNTDSV